MARTRQEIKKQKRRKSGLYKFFITTFLVLVSLLVVGGVAFGYVVMQAAEVTSSAKQELERGEHSQKRQVVVNPNEDNISILFLGLDDRDGNLQGRTDALLLATFNKKEGTVKMLSIPRDSRVEIAGKNKEDKRRSDHPYRLNKSKPIEIFQLVMEMDSLEKIQEV